MTTYIEAYIFGIAGVTEKRDFSAANNAAGSATSYGNINESKSKRDERRAERVNKEIIGGENTAGTIKYYTTQTLLDADNAFSGTKLLTKERAVHITGRDFETNTTEVARQAARVAERGTYNSGTDTYAVDTGTEKNRVDARTLESGTTEVARQAARVAESGTYNASNNTYDSTTNCKEKTRQDYRDRETADEELTPWDPDNAANANYRTYINFPGNVG
tara:strand:- start:13259 stop:13915 length:657 start_codon:yes stop_codon:yes gene_type:complete